MKKFVLAFILFITFYVCAEAQLSTEIEKKTFLYSEKGTEKLYLDKYDKIGSTEKKPCVIFMFGGGFVKGQRDSDRYYPYFNHLVNNGYAVVSIDYRLGMKDLKSGKMQFSEEVDPIQLISVLVNTINIAVEDLFDATSYIVNHSEEWNIDKNMIIASGSSAGAVTVLQGEYSICNKTALTQKLPKDFNYVGVMSFAGAILSLEGDLKWASSPTPILMFHGDADKQVPYDKIEMLSMGFYGSKHIARQLDNLKTPYYFYKVENAGHEMASRPIQYNLNEIDSFLQKLVKEKEHLIINTDVLQLDKPEVNKEFTIMDYIFSNYSDKH